MAEIEELERSKEVTQLCTFYIDLQAEVTRMQVLECMSTLASAVLCTHDSCTLTRLPGHRPLQKR